MRLHYIPGSAAMAPHAALAEIGADYELVLVDRDELDKSPPAYYELNPWGRVPTLEDGELVLTESAAIMLHLADRHPDAGLAPALGTFDRAELYRWLMYLTNTLQPAFLRFFYAERYTVDPAGEEGMRTSESQTLQRHFEWLEQELTERDWLLPGDRRSAADLFLFMLVRWGRRLDPPAWELPGIRQHAIRTLALPGVQRMLAEQELELPELS